jgi:hypothetical protein
MTEYTVHFEKGTRVGARSLRMVQVKTETVKQAAIEAKKEFTGWRAGYRLVRVDHIDDASGRVVIDW